MSNVSDLPSGTGNDDALSLDEAVSRLVASETGNSPADADQDEDEETNEDDTTMTKNGVSLLIDSMSYQYLVGAEIDYKEDINGAQFVIKNPNASTTCGCGSSFSV